MPPLSQDIDRPDSGTRAQRTLAERLLWVLTDSSEPDWRRPRPGPSGRRGDVLGALALMALAMLLLALIESFSGAHEDRPRWLGYLMVGLQILPLTVRRRWPGTVMVICTAIYVTGYYLTPVAFGQSGTTLGLYVAVYTLVAWGRSRQAVRVLISLFMILLLVWVGIDLTITGSYEQMVEGFDSRSGPFEPMTAFSAYSFVLNILGFGITIALGWTAWRSALRDHQNRAQSEQLRSQSEQLARQAVVDERLRIARELHDVIAHHVSAIGIQAGAARKVLRRDPELAEEALRTVEGSSRQAVAETRQLLGILREDAPADTGEDGGAREPGAAAASPGPRVQEIEDLVREHAQRGLAVTLSWVDGAEAVAADLPPTLGLSMYRCVQEALANVVRHSTATSADVVIRCLDAPADEEAAVPRDREAAAPDADAAGRDGRTRRPRAIELEVLDAGRPRGGAEGTGFGLTGLRERVQLHGGTVQIGARAPGPGWRVRARFPLGAEGSGALGRE